jgi:hypothetical protein
MANLAQQTRGDSDVRATIRAQAQALGFDAVGFAAPDLPRPLQAAYRHYIEQGREGDMAWLARDPERRQSPQGLWPEARSVIVLGVNYGPDEDPLATLARRDRATISAYARNRDYHDLIKGRLKQLASRLHHDLGAAVKVFVDTAPVLEKPLAQQAGIGWQGKHSNLVSRRFGSWLFLGEISPTCASSRTRPRTTTAAAAARVWMSARPTRSRHPTSSTPGAASPISRSSTRGRSRGNSGSRSATGSTAATTAWPSAPGTSSRRPRARRASRPATICAHRIWPSSPGSTMPPSGAASPARRSNAPDATASCATS